MVGGDVSAWAFYFLINSEDALQNKILFLIIFPDGMGGSDSLLKPTIGSKTKSFVTPLYKHKFMETESFHSIR
jgi:hypothetical protein